LQAQPAFKKEKKAMGADVYQKVTDIIVGQLEKGVRPWFQPWNAEHAAGRITKPVRGNGVPYRGINVIMLWSAAVKKDYSAPIWLTFKQAHELGAHVRKGEHGSLVVYANSITRTETDEETGEETTQEIPFMKGYTMPRRKPFWIPCSALSMPSGFSPIPRRKSGMAATGLTTA
jgi:antirestriction protein ArdC